MDEDIVMQSASYPYNMAGWCVEKSSTAVEDLARTIDFLKTTSLSKAEREEAERLLGASLYNSTKVLSFACGAEWKVSDSQVIVDKGYEGWEEVAVRYGLVESTRAGRRARALLSVLKRLEEVLRMEQVQRRTLAHEVLAAFREEDPGIESLREALENVTFGRMKWDEFASLAARQIDQLRSTLPELPADPPFDPD